MDFFLKTPPLKMTHKIGKHSSLLKKYPIPKGKRICKNKNLEIKLPLLTPSPNFVS